LEQFVVAESKFLDDMANDLGILGGNIQDLISGILHTRNYVRFAPLAVNVEFHTWFFSHIVGQFHAQPGDLLLRPRIIADHHYPARGDIHQIPDLLACAGILDPQLTKQEATINRALVLDCPRS
jgi:hypothetical protein